MDSALYGMLNFTLGTLFGWTFLLAIVLNPWSTVLVMIVSATAATALNYYYDKRGIK